MDSADVLSTVQNSMSAGQDPSQALSRLMDWAEARGVSALLLNCVLVVGEVSWKES
jgi:hypothetical protein